MSETAGAALGVVEARHLVELGAHHRRYDELRNPLAAAHDERLVPRIEQDHLEFAAVVTVDGARRVGQHDAVLQGETAARSDLGFVARRNGDCETGRDEGCLLYTSPSPRDPE